MRNRPSNPNLEQFLSRLDNVSNVDGNGQYMASCPAHPDNNPSLAVSTGKKVKVVRECKAGCSDEEVMAAWRELPKRRTATRKKRKAKGPRTIVKTDPYHDGTGKLRFEKVRFEPKGFMCRQPDGNGGWINNLAGVPRLLYRLPELAKAKLTRRVFIVEGEKDVDRLRELGLVATTNMDGAGKWKDEDCGPLYGRRVVIIPDNDKPGLDHARKVAAMLHGKAKSVRVLDLPDLPACGDVSNWLDNGGTKRELRSLAKKAPLYDPDAEDAPSKRGTNKRTLSGVEPEEVESLWEGRIPLGKVTIAMGDPGLGKSFFSLFVACQGSTGQPFPGQDKSQTREPCDVLLLNAEDNAADTIVPRLIAMGGDLDRIHIIDGVPTKDDDEAHFNVDNPEHRAKLEEDLEDLSPGLLIIDPWNAYLGRADSYKDQEIRRALTPLKKLAEKYGVTILCIHHLNKRSDASAMQRASGSMGLPAAARSVLLVSKYPYDKTGETRLVTSVKSTNSGKVPPIGFQIVEETKGQPKIEWIEKVRDVSPEEALEPPKRKPGRPADERKRAEQFVRRKLRKGPVWIRKLIGAAKKKRIAEHTLRDALGTLKCDNLKIDGRSHWALPEKGGKP